MKFIKLLVLCLLDLPYYYNIICLTAMAVFAYIFTEGKHVFMVMFGALALLFQPFMKINISERCGI